MPDTHSGELGKQQIQQESRFVMPDTHSGELGKQQKQQES
jgi:hypothetical protein